ncbi:helix-turn-helix domain-containing protein [Armatimonas rosea]|uniref:Excisionase family DNA binding protein n=1 Tax=Armatimonas rosea TaxID=685828 RepID=A0A7W9SVA6_ARMRO|nr:excisionase family DNA binding protein [Armatimonas rosea]
MNRIAYSVEEAAQLCGVSEENIREMIRAGKLLAQPMGATERGHLRIGAVELERFFLGMPRPSQTALGIGSVTVATAPATVATEHKTVSTPVRSRRSPSGRVGADREEIRYE